MTMIDHLSKEIRDLYPGRPKQNENRVYKLLFTKVIKTPEGSRLKAPWNRILPSAFTIFDYVIEQRVKIQLVKDTVPTGPNAFKATTDIPGRVHFRKSNLVEIRITHENYPTTMDIDKYLFFSPWNDLNATAKFFVRHKFGFIYTMIDKKGMSRKSVEATKLITFAHSKVLEMSEEEVGILLTALKLGNAKVMSMDEQVDALIKHYANPKNAQHFQSLTEESELKLRAVIKNAQKHQIIRVDDSGRQWIWSKGEEPICNQYPGKTLDASLLLFFATPHGSETEKILTDLVRAAEKLREKERTEKKPKEVKKVDKKTDIPPAAEKTEKIVVET